MAKAEKTKIVLVRAWTAGRMMYTLLYSSTGGTGYGMASLDRPDMTDQELRSILAEAHPGVTAHVYAPGAQGTEAMVAALEFEAQTVLRIRRETDSRQIVDWASKDPDMRRVRAGLPVITGTRYQLAHVSGNLWDLSIVVGKSELAPIRVVVASPPDTATSARWVLRTDGGDTRFVDGPA